METFYDIGSGDLQELWETDFVEDPLKFGSDQEMLSDWLGSKPDTKNSHVILHDKLMSDALLGTLPIKTEHSYSLSSDGDSMPESPGSMHNKMEDMDDECYSVMPMNSATDASHLQRKYLHNNTSGSGFVKTENDLPRQHHQYLNLIQNGNSNDSETSSYVSDEIDIDDSTIKEEPMSPHSSCPPSPTMEANNNSTRSKNKNLVAFNSSNVNLSQVAALTNSDLVFEHKNGSMLLSSASQSLLKNQHHHLLLGNSHHHQSSRLMPKLNIKMEPNTSLTNGSSGTNSFGLPPTPPSSLPSDDSEGNQSPEHSSPMSPPIAAQTSATTTSSSRRQAMALNSNNSSSSSANSQQGRLYSGSSTRQPIHTPLISSQPKGSTGTLILTEEEKRTLQAEGYPIPTKLPLTKAEEKSLKKIRRKIKNKISAQESRRKKKEYMDQLERKVEILVSENSDYRKRVESLEGSNASLQSQLSKLQALLNRQSKKN